MTYQVDADGIAVITIDLKDRSMNVIDDTLGHELNECIDNLVANDAVKGAVITSGKDSFVAGADLMWLGRVTGDSGRDVGAMLEACKGLQDVLRRLETCGKPIAAAITGTALGGGLEICLASHYRVLADNPKAVVGLPEVQVGLLPGAGGTQRLPRLIGVEAALPLLLKGVHLKPAKALAAGLVHEVVAPEKLLDAAKKWIREVGDPVQPWDHKGFKVPGGTGLMHPKAVMQFMFGTALVAKNTNHNYPAPISILSAVYEGTVVPIEAGLEIETRYFVSLLQNPVARNMIRSLFVHKGAADKLSRRPKGVERSRVKKLGVLGAGMMGSGIAYVSARAGMEVVLLDRSEEHAQKGKGYSQMLLEKAVKRGKSTQEKAEQLLSRIEATDDYAALEGCDMVIEAVFEDRDIKADVTRKALAVIPDGAVFASNTSTLPITGLAQVSDKPEQFVGVHFFSPVDKMPLVEVILGEQTNDETLARALDYIGQLRKTPIVVSDSRGFYTSRVFAVGWQEGINLLAEGVNPALIENAAKMAGLPVGPLAVVDEVSLELIYTARKQTKEDLGDAFTEVPSDKVITRFVEEFDRRGKRFGKGFYDYPEGGKKHLWKGLADVFPLADEQPSVEDIQKRLLHSQSLDAVRCMDEGVVHSAAEADIGSILGWGFPAHTGGAISWIETVGLTQFVAECDELAAVHGERFSVPDSLRQKAAANESFFAPAA